MHSLEIRDNGSIFFLYKLLLIFLFFSGRATKILDDTDLNASLDEQTRDLLTETYVKCYNNMAACQLKVSECSTVFDKSVIKCNCTMQKYCFSEMLQNLKK